jgi:hypothetical protein
MSDRYITAPLPTPASGLPRRTLSGGRTNHPVIDELVNHGHGGPGEAINTAALRLSGITDCAVKSG